MELERRLNKLYASNRKEDIIKNFLNSMVRDCQKSIYPDLDHGDALGIQKAIQELEDNKPERSVITLVAWAQGKNPRRDLLWNYLNEIEF